MKKATYLSVVLMLYGFGVMAQDSIVVNTIRVKKKRVVYPSAPVTDWKPRPFTSDPVLRYSSQWKTFLVGYEYFKYSYFRAGIQFPGKTGLITNWGITAEACFDQEIYGAGTFAQKRIFEMNGSNSFLIGAHAAAFYSNSSSFCAASPTITFHTAELCFGSFQLSYGYKFLLLNKALPPGRVMEASVPGMNAHHFAITYILPFYL